MTSPAPSLARAAVLSAVLSWSACNCGATGPCTDDAQCDATGQGFSKCDKDQGICVCVSDRACGPNELCNGAGRCQAQSGCTTNDDCNEQAGAVEGEGEAEAAAAAGIFFCDVTTSSCLSVSECNPLAGEVCCTLDDQCPFRSVCNTTGRKCVAGCHDNADCLIGEGCVGAGFGNLGQCGTSCTSDNLCPFGSLCNLTGGTCEIDQRGPYCLGCAGGVTSDDCGNFGNYCLTDTVVGGEFCGVECAQGQVCPNGYDCQQVIIIPPAAPFCNGPERCVIADGAVSGACSVNNATACASDADCPFAPPFGDCRQLVGRSGSCEANTNVDCAVDADCAEGGCNLIECVGSEGASFGNCTCTRDSDCPIDECLDADETDPQNPIEGHCRLSGHPCFQNFECDIIACVEGGCLIGSNCAPSNDRTCGDLQTVPATP